MKQFWMALLVVVSLPSVGWAESYVCIGDLSTGFKWNGRGWEHTIFNVGDDKFVVSQIPEREREGGMNYGVKKSGQTFFAHRCSRADQSSRVVCGGLGYGFLMDVETLRYQEFYGIGYIDGGDSMKNTPSLTIGKCTRLD